MIDISRWRPVHRPNQRRSVEEVLHLRIRSQDGWPSFQLALYFIILIDIQTIVSPLSLVWYIMTFYFLQPCLPSLYQGQGPLMYMYALLGKSHKLWTYRPIFSSLLPSLCHLICCIVLLSCFHFLPHSYHYLLHFISYLSWIDDSSHLCIKRVVISLPSSHHLALIKRF